MNQGNGQFPPGFVPGQQPQGYPQQAQTAYQQQPHMQVGGAPAPSHPPVPSLAGAQVGTVNARYFNEGEDGDHTVEVEAVKLTGTGPLPTLIMELRAVESTNGNVQIGGVYSWGRKFDVDGQPPSYGRGNAEIKGIVCQLIDMIQPGTNAAQNWDDRFLAFVTDASNPCKGQRFALTTWQKPNKKKPGSFTVCEFAPMQPGQTRGLVQGPATPAPAQPPAAAQLPQGAVPQQAPYPPGVPGAPWQGGQGQ